ncbi:MAG: 2-C-methyl-D-erythritol 2,4-cyclodiphosphate synthase [Candidatus Omnitrophica bacterium]|nr:2-C-methyl-D-erythritol 2,4-cyclodiphosphate synthase [Candidatus Omnitrophota bacterium]
MKTSTSPLDRLRIGFGTDLHRLVKGRKLILGGVIIPHSKGLAGHSDADALIHAVIDAVLGAMGASDIGELFPDTDRAFKDADSKPLLKQVMLVAARKRYRLINMDAVINAEEPKLKPHKEAIRRSMAKLLSVTADRVNIKAKTREGLDAVGMKKAISVECAVLMERAR